MVSKTTIGLSVMRWGWPRPGIKGGQQDKIRCCGPHPLERGLQQLSLVRGRPARGSGCGALAAKPREGEVIDKGIEETDGLLGRNVVIEPLREQELFVAVRAVDK